MLIKTKGIVFHTLKYSDTSIITKIYTKESGLQSYLIRGARSVGKRSKAMLFQPPNILDLEVYRKENAQLNKLKEFKLSYVFRSIPFQVFKSSIALFMMEVLKAILKEEESDEELYNYIEASLIRLDEPERFNPNFHLYFLLSLTNYLGFMPDNNCSASRPYFDLQKGMFTTDQPIHSYFLNAPLSAKISEMLNGSEDVVIASNERSDILVGLLQYYDLHITNFKKIKSYQVLHEIFQ